MRRPRTAKIALEPQPVPAVAPQPQPALTPQPKSIGRNPEWEIALGARIRAARIAVRMSQNALAKAIGVSFQQVQKYELGKDRVAASTLQSIARVIGVHPGVFYDESIPVPVGSIPDVEASFKAADVLGQIRDPRVLDRLLALAKLLAEVEP